MSNAEYISHGQYSSGVVSSAVRGEPNMIEIQVDQLLAEQNRTFYWLAKETGISHTTLWRLKKGKALGINFETLEKICQTLKCQPGDIMIVSDGNKRRRKSSSKGTRGKK
jgi:putative transcriptional regulator